MFYNLIMGEDWLTMDYLDNFDNEYLNKYKKNLVSGKNYKYVLLLVC
jgi:hypothetical protein